MKITESLSGEHRVIEQVVRCLLEMATRAGEGGIDAEAARAAVEFFRTFADRCHHKKEEDVLFPALAERGFGTSVGPVAVMLEEHELGRRHLGRIEAALQMSEAGAPGASEAFASAARAYADLLLQHIAKEDHVLFPMADQLLSGHAGEAVRTGFESAEAALDHGRLHARMIGIADDLGVKFGVRRAAAPAEFHGCCHGPRTP
jgi:hemerythrin-like domain-containing protein